MSTTAPTGREPTAPDDHPRSARAHRAASPLELLVAPLVLIVGHEIHERGTPVARDRV
ncbi:hypothetical protein [Microbacterium pseudoresistens]|uniref:Uncharacterized protein n=1 Tax=Microbacterium pseudoresistens TaxID=640634 RepID=A0A7Y9JQB2_9MICO|nr:hypothetical protein [Microbacterium pseudoresistens]NYD55509.1 hypothetical protein [Microbacterium pseudoresistens]